MRQEIVVMILRNLFVHPEHPLGSQLANVVLKLLRTPSFLLGQQFSRNKAVFAR